MPTFTLPFAVDSQVNPSGIPSDDTGRGNGWFSVGSGGDYGLGIKTFDADSKYVQDQIVGSQKPNLYFRLDSTQIGLLNAAMAASQHVYSLVLTIIHKRVPLTIADTANITVGAVLERGGPGTGNLQTLYQIDITANDTYQTDTFTVPPPVHGDGSYFLISELQTFEMGFYLLDQLGGNHPFASIYRIEQAFLTATYSTAPIVVSGATATGGAGVLVGRSDDATGTLTFTGGAPPELHLNQWGLMQFVMRSRLEDRM